MLVGRQPEQQAIDRLAAAARLGTSGVLALTGEAGVGKTALLEDAVARLDGMHILRATGLESEREIPFGMLLQLLRPALGALDGIPPVQADALSAALALPRPAHSLGSRDRFMIGAAVLSLICRYAEEGAVAVVVDDLHLADSPSANALTFAARRLAADPVVVLLGRPQPRGRHAGRRACPRSPSAAWIWIRRGRCSGASAGRPHPRTACCCCIARRKAIHSRCWSCTRQTWRWSRASRPVCLCESRAPSPTPSEDDSSSWMPSARAVLLVAAVCGADLRLIADACTALGLDDRRLGDAEDLGLDHAPRRSRRVPASAHSRRGVLRGDRTGSASRASRGGGCHASRRSRPARVAPVRGRVASGCRCRGPARRSGRARRGPRRARSRLRGVRAVGATDSGSGGARSTPAASSGYGLDGRERRTRARTAERESPGCRQHATQGSVRSSSGRRSRPAPVRFATRWTTCWWPPIARSPPNDEAVALADAVHATYYLGDARTASTLADRLEALRARVNAPRARALGLMATGMARTLAGRGGAAEIRAAVPLLETDPDLTHDPRRLSWLLLAPLYLRDATHGSASAGARRGAARRSGDRRAARRCCSISRSIRPPPVHHGDARRRTTRKRSAWPPRPAKRLSWRCRSPGWRGWNREPAGLTRVVARSGRPLAVRCAGHPRRPGLGRARRRRSRVVARAPGACRGAVCGARRPARASRTR